MNIDALATSENCVCNDISHVSMRKGDKNSPHTSTCEVFLAWTIFFPVYDAIRCYCKMTTVMALDSVTSFLRWKDVTYTCKYMRHNPTIGGISSVQWRNVGRLPMYFRRSLCVKSK